MTEHEWAHETEPAHLLSFLRASGRVSERKLRLFALACCRHSPDWPADECSREAVVLAERFADDPTRGGPALPTTWDIAALSAVLFATDGPGWAASPEQGLRTSADRQAQSDLLRCIIGNPFRGLVIDPGWRTATVVILASAIYREHAFRRMPLLGDTLANAGCDDEDILAHCRDTDRHARGCWVVDQLLGHA